MSFLSRRTLSGSLRRAVGRRFSHSAPLCAPYLVSPGQLRDLISGGKDVTVLDASWFMPNSPRKAHGEFLSKRIPKAQFLDLDEVASEHPLGLKHMLPSEETFANACETFGIRADTHVVLYDSHGVFSSPRALYMFRSFGHSNSSIVNGGLPLWELEGFATEAGPIQPSPRSGYPRPSLDVQSVRNYDQMVENSSTKSEVVVDARSTERYSGSASEPRPGLPSGHIPNSISLPFTTFLKTNQGLNSTYTTMRSTKEIRDALDTTLTPQVSKEVLAGQQSIITTCGSGMTAGVLWLGLKLLSADKVSLYDESWTGYAMRSTSKIAKGE